MKNQKGYGFIVTIILLLICSLVVTTQLSELVNQQKTSQFFSHLMA